MTFLERPPRRANIKDRVVSFLERFTQERFVISSKEQCREVAEYCSRSLFRGDKQHAVSEALVNFTGSLFDVDQVGAVAFLTVDQRPGPTCFGIEIFRPLVLNNPDRESIDKIYEVEAELFKSIRGIIPPSLGFVNIPNPSDLVAAERLSRERWDKDPDKHPLAFVEFSRKSTA